MISFASKDKFDCRTGGGLRRKETRVEEGIWEAEMTGT